MTNDKATPDVERDAEMYAEPFLDLELGCWEHVKAAYIAGASRPVKRLTDEEIEAMARAYAEVIAPAPTKENPRYLTTEIAEQMGLIAGRAYNHYREGACAVRDACEGSVK